MAGRATPFGSQVDTSGEIDVLKQLMGPFGELLKSLFDPDKMLLNQLTGSPFGGMQARLSGRTPRMHDIMMYEQQKTFFDAGARNPALTDHKQALLRNFYEKTGFANADVKAQSAANSIYNPVGMVAELAMMSYGESGARQARAQGYMAMGIHAPALGQSMQGAGVMANQAMMRQATQALTTDFLDDPNAYGGFNLQGQGEVFQQMAQRSIIGRGDLTKGKIAGTTQKVREMSQAVGAMQELFGGTIPELFDKMDAIFGGNAGAMGGQALLGRVLRMKQTSAVTGQSLQSLAQMNIMGGRYAEAAGTDAGIGAMAAEETGLAGGVNYAGGGFSTRRINAGRLRQAALRSNVAAATSQATSYYAGAYAMYLRKQGRTSEEIRSMTTEQQRAASNKFAELAGGASNIGELASITGASAAEIRNMALSDEAQEYMSDDSNVARYGVRRSLGGRQRAIASAIHNQVRRTLIARGQADKARNLRMDMFIKNGNLASSDSMIATLEGDQFGMRDAAGLVGNQLDQGAQALFGMRNGQELQAHLFQTRNAGKLREYRDRRAAADEALGVKSGGVIGIMNYLSDEGDGSKKTECVRGGSEHGSLLVGEIAGMGRQKNWYARP